MVAVRSCGEEGNQGIVLGVLIRLRSVGALNLHRLFG